MLYNILILWLLVGLVAGCSTHAETDKGEFEQHGQAPLLNLESYAPTQSRAGPQNPAFAVAAAISGGGHRAANFGAGALIELEKLAVGANSSNVLLEIDYFSTVSGGGFAAGSYLSTLHDYLDGSSSSPDFTRFNYGHYFSVDYLKGVGKQETDEFCRQCETRALPVCVRRNIERGYRAAVITSFLKPNIWFTNKDRGDYLEEKIDSKLLGACWRDPVGASSLVLGDVMPPKGVTPRLPFWVTNATVFQNGAIFPFSPDILKHYGVSAVDHRVKTRCVGAGGDNCFADSYQIPVSVGVKASASFPGAIPASTLGSTKDPTHNPYIHLVDGGISDNLGILTALSLLEQDKGAQGQPLSRKILIVIDAFKSNQEPFSSSAGSPSALAVLWQVTNEMTLSSWRGRHMRFLDHLSAGGDEAISVIYLNFETVIYDEHDTVVENCGEFDKAKLAGLAKKVPTDFNLDLEEQETLMCAGRVAVKSLASCIGTAFTGSGPVICGR